MGLYKNYEGDIYVGSKNLKHFSNHELRKICTLVTQDVFIFNGTIIENLMIAKPNATKNELEEVCEMVGLNDFINSLPGKYEHILKNNGNGLSIGQKQRLAFARALLRDSKVYLFDEVTSALDNDATAIVNSLIIKLSRKATVLFVTHHNSQIIMANKLIDMSTYDLNAKNTESTNLVRPNVISCNFTESV